MERITFEIENHKELNLLIAIAEKLGIKRYIYTEAAKSKPSDLQKLYHIIDKGVDTSTFGDINEWQKTVRTDRDLNIHSL